MPDRPPTPNASSPEITRPDAAQEVGDLAFAASFLVGLLEDRSAPEDTTNLARCLLEHLRDLERVLSGRPEGPEEDSASTAEEDSEDDLEPPAKPAGEKSHGREVSNRNESDQGGTNLDAALRRRFRTPINPNPTSRPPLDEGAELQLSPETLETVGRAADALDRFYHGPVSRDLITEVALRHVLYGVATEREDSVLAKWLGRSHGRRR